MSKKITSATKEAAFSEADMTLSAEAKEAISKQDFDEPGDDLADDSYYQVIPSDKEDKSTVVDLDEANKTKDSKKDDDGDDPPESDSDEPPKEQPKDTDDKGGEGDDPPETKTISYEDLSKDIEDGTDVLIKDHSGEEVSVKQLLEDRKNDRDWKKTNTENAQKVSDDRKALEADQADFEEFYDESEGRLSDLDVGDEIKEVLADNDFLSEADKWFDGEDKNPIRKILNAIDNQAKKQVEDEENAAIAQTEDNLEIEKLISKDIADIKAADESYDDAKIDKLCQYAGENNLTLPVAKKAMEYDDMTAGTKTLTDKVAKLTKELKERNAELTKLRKRPGGTTDGDVEPDEISKGPGIEGYDKPAASWEEADKRVRKATG